jgi:hypothetical protein
VGTYANRPFSRLAGLGTSSDYAKQTLTFTGDGVKAYSILAHIDASVTGTVGFKIQDTTAGSAVLQGTLTVAVGGAVSCSLTNGTLIVTRALADGAYRFDCQTTSVTAAHTNELRIGNATGTAASILLSGVQASDATFPAGLIPSTTGTVTTVADALSYTLNITPAQIDAWGGLTVYAQMARPVHADATGTLSAQPVVWRLGAAAPHISSLMGSGSRSIQGLITNSANSNPSSAIPSGSALVSSVQFKNLMTAPAAAVDVGSGLGAFSTGASAFSSFGAQTLYVGTISGGGSELFGVLTRLKIAAGLQTLAYTGAG